MSDYSDSAGTAVPSGALPEHQQPAFAGWVREGKGSSWRLICVGPDEAVIRRRLLDMYLNEQHAILARGTLPVGRLHVPGQADSGAARGDSPARPR